MKLLLNISGLLLFINLLISCGATYHSNINVSEVNMSQYKVVAKHEFLYSREFIFSSDSTKVICIGDNNKLARTISFFIFSNIKNDRISDNYNNVEKVEWVDNSTIKYKLLPGNIKMDTEALRYMFIKLDNKH